MRRFLFFSLLALMSVFATAQESFYLMKISSNQSEGTANVHLAAENGGEVALIVADVYGKPQARWFGNVEPGIHKFQVALRAKGHYVLWGSQNSKSSSVTMLCNKGRGANHIEYVGRIGEFPKVAYQKQNMEDSVEQREASNAEEEVVEDSTSIVPPIVSSITRSGSDPFRVALSLSPFSLNQFEQGYTFQVGDKTATTPAQLQQIYRDLGSTEMFVRLATKRHKTYKADGTLDNTTDGEADENANVHTFDQVIQTCKLAAALDIPINPEVMCAYTYMDMDNSQAPRFEEYPEIYALQNGKKWEELSLDEICTVLEAYGEFVGDSILATGCTVNDWNIGNEANFGFAGIGIGMPNAFDKRLAKAGVIRRYLSSLFGRWWLKKHVWRYEAQTLAAVKRGILRSYMKAGKDASEVRFSTHIATVVSTPRCSAAFFRYMEKHGYEMQTAGISYYPSAPAMTFNKKRMLKKTVKRINKKCGMPVFIAEFSYPSGEMEGAFAGWNKKLKGYEKDQQGQADIYRDVISWGRGHGMAGIRYWAPDYKGWYSMSMFEFGNGKVGTAKTILNNHKEIVR